MVLERRGEERRGREKRGREGKGEERRGEAIAEPMRPWWTPADGGEAGSQHILLDPPLLYSAPVTRPPRHGADVRGYPALPKVLK